MTSPRRFSRIGVFVSMFVAVAAGARAQNAGSPSFLGGQTAGAPAVTGAPYSGDGTTTVKAILYDGTRIERHVTARFYRDSAGRIRREQTLLGLEELNPASDSEKVVMIVDPVAGVFYALNPGSHQAQRMPTSAPALAGQPPASPKEESLGTRQIEGITAIGHKTVTTIPAGQVGNDRPIEISDERWESPDLKVVLFSRHHDPRTGDIEYRLTNINRAEPPRELFTVPPTYTIVDVPAAPARPRR
jgi:hypothetical protein